ncbi:MAG TPA: aromatic acid exporter family protein [Candidatus Methylacidiphilales bacterium]
METDTKVTSEDKAAPPPFDATAALLFSAKAAVAAVLAYLIYRGLNLPGAAWAAPVSAVLVTQPTFQPSIQASIARFWANLIGALLGSLAVLLLGPTPWALAAAVVVAGFLCQAIRLDEGLRPAYVSVVIVIFTGGERVWAGSFDRVLAVLVGCLVALVVGAVADLPLHRLAERSHRHGKKGAAGPENARIQMPNE